MTNRKEWVVHPSERVRQPACVSLPKTTYVLPPVSVMVFIFLSTLMHLLSSQFNLVCKVPGIYMEMISHIHLGYITAMLFFFFVGFFFSNMTALLFLRLYLFSSALGLL